MTTPMAELRRHLAELEDLASIASLLGWDQSTMLPPAGGASRAEAMATIESITHERFVSGQTAELLDRAAAELADADPDSDDARILAQTRRRFEKASRVPASLAAELARSAATGYQLWVRARAENDFASFAPQLARHFELVQRYVDCFEGFNERYDVLLDDFEPGLTSMQVTQLFDELKAELTPLLALLREQRIDGELKYVHFPNSAQRELAREVVGWMGFDPDAWRLDETAHPFAARIGRGDIRITNRYEENFFPGGLYGAMHECGHGLYEAGIAPELYRTPVGAVRSLALHESQSRLWENFVGRSLEFCGLVTPRLRALSGGTLEQLDPQTLFRAVNEVQPSLIRTEADETTYGLHVIVRFEIEQRLISGDLEVNDLPDAWNSRINDYLGIEVPSDTLGVLQDVHWSEGLVGYFPTYALGNLIAGQLWERLHVALPELEDQIAAGEFAPLRGWLGENVHRHGSKFDSPELLTRVVGGPISVQPFVRYLKAKLSQVYELQLP